MKFSSISLSLVIACVGMVGATCAFAQSLPSSNHYGCFKSSAYLLHPEIEIILQLTPEQTSKLDAARAIRLEDEEVKKTREAFQADKENPEAKNAFYSAEKKANTTYREVVDATLNGDQSARILEINEFAESVWKELEEIAHWGERTKKMKEIGPERLKTILTPAEQTLLGLDASSPAPAAGASPGVAP